jgi:two-component system, cell cycle response regulator DivK
MKSKSNKGQSNSSDSHKKKLGLNSGSGSSLKPMNNSSKKSGKPVYNWEGKTILIAEDEEFNFLYLKEILAVTKATLLRALDGEMAVEICRGSSVDLVLMDIKMPRMNGLDATRHIREFDAALPVIAQTAYAMVEDDEKCLGAGCTEYLTKPININVLLSIIDKYMH